MIVGVLSLKNHPTDKEQMICPGRALKCEEAPEQGSQVVSDRRPHAAHFNLMLAE